ncbi:MAG: glycosyltransferase, partial [Planctomycetales bacterium]
MRIAHVITRLIVGGAQENTILCCQDVIDRYQDDVLLVTGPSLGPEGSLVKDALARKVPMATIDSMRRSIHPWRDFKSYRNLKRVLCQFRPDVVHTHSAKAGVLGRYAASALRIPVIVHTVHGAPFHPYQNPAARWLFRRCERSAAKHCHQIVCVADAMTDLIVDAGIAPREKCLTVYSGMDVDLFLQAQQMRNKVRHELGYQDQHVVVGKVARLFHLKGHSDVIQAARDVVDRHPNVRFLMVGDGVLHHQLQGQIRHLGLQDHFQFTGLVSPQRVAELIG